MTMPGRRYSCAKCRKGFEVPDVSDADKKVICPLCGELTPLVPLKGGGKASHEQRNEFNLPGCILLFGGLAAVCFKFPWGLLGGAVLVCIGTKMTRVNICSKCDGKVEDKQAKSCPHCQAVFVDDVV